MKLAQTQAALYKLIVGASDAKPQWAKRIVRGTARLSPGRRVDIYAQQYPARMQESLLNDFPKLAKLLGEAVFWELVGAYAHAYPSRHHDLGQFGSRLEKFLRTHAHDDARADLADLAALEWNRADCFTERDAKPVGRDALTKLSPQGFSEARLALIPGLRILDLEHDVLPVWRAMDEGRRAPKPKAGEHFAVIWRQGFEVYHASVGAAEAAALRATRKGKTLGEVMEAFAEREDAAQAAFKALAGWVAEGMVAQVS